MKTVTRATQKINTLLMVAIIIIMAVIKPIPPGQALVESPQLPPLTIEQQLSYAYHNGYHAVNWAEQGWVQS